MSSELLAALLLGLACGVARAEAPDAGAPPDGYSNDIDQGIMECPADKVRARRARAAELERFRGAAPSVAAETVNSAWLQAGAWFEAQRLTFVTASLARVRAGVEALALRTHIGAAPREGAAAPGGSRPVSAPACRAMAMRDEAGCAALEEDEIEPCRVFVRLRRASATGVEGCAALAEPERTLCRAVVGRRAEDCRPLAGEGRARCEAAVAAVGGLDPVCGAALDASRCGWGLLGRGLSEGRAACERVAPSASRATPEHARTHAVCLAVLAGEAHRCPTESPSAPARVAPAVAEVAVMGSLSGPRALVVLGSPMPALCHLDVTVRGGGAARVMAVVEQGSWAPSVWALPLPLSVDPFAAHASVTVQCVPRLVW
ncbi:MAG: hypothetical protein H6746_19885 [Deltaproteobacteria bacterium]|nr:hypothetical protein [Deltaproteobacteria bacterium]